MNKDENTFDAIQYNPVMFLVTESTGSYVNVYQEAAIKLENQKLLL
jgi:hypothetical protein